MFRFDEEKRNAEDTRYAYDVLNKCKSVLFVDAPLYGYFIRFDGAVSHIDYFGMVNIIETWNYIHQCEGTQISKRVKQEWVEQYIRFYYASIRCGAPTTSQARKILLNELLFILFQMPLTIKEKTALLYSLLFEKMCKND